MVAVASSLSLSQKHFYKLCLPLTKDYLIWI